MEGKELNYTSIVRKIWELTPRQIIYDNSNFDTKDYNYSKYGYKWIYEIQLSVQIGNTSQILNEIIHMCVLMKYTLNLEIVLQNIDTLMIKIDQGSLSYDVQSGKKVSNRMLFNHTYGYYS